MFYRSIIQASIANITISSTQMILNHRC